MLEHWILFWRRCSQKEKFCVALICWISLSLKEHKNKFKIPLKNIFQQVLLLHRSIVKKTRNEGSECITISVSQGWPLSAYGLTVSQFPGCSSLTRGSFIVSCLDSLKISGDQKNKQNCCPEVQESPHAAVSIVQYEGLMNTKIDDHEL